VNGILGRGKTVVAGVNLPADLARRALVPLERMLALN
jgi:quinolinate synthase